MSFKANFRAVLLNTISNHGIPDSAYEEYVRYDDDYYIYASELSIHTRNLMETGQVSLMFIENNKGQQTRPRGKRVILKSIASRVSRACDTFERVMELFEQRFHDFPQLIRSLPDYHLFKIRPQSGCFVRSYGQAYALEGDSLSDVNCGSAGFCR